MSILRGCSIIVIIEDDMNKSVADTGQVKKVKLPKFTFWVITLVSLFFIGWGISLTFNKNRAPVTATSPQANSSAPAPKANRPSQKDINSYKVAADLPRFINIPSIKVPKTRIMHLGVNKNGQIAVPANIYDTGWYTSSAKPGQAGAMFIFGHVSSWEANGIFHDLKKLRTGDLVTIERGDGVKYTYKVEKTKTYPHDKVNMNEVLAPSNANIPALNLMTCAGKVIKGTSEFTERYVVFTSLQK
jgi:LPXTG-site transpeptidase (sortase) family protein